MSETLLDGLRHKVLRALTRNREPGYHFIGRFLDTTFEKVSTAETRILLDAESYCMETNGTASMGALAVLADVAAAVCIRADMDSSARLATVNLQLQFTGMPAAGKLQATSFFRGYFQRSAGRLGLAQVAVHSGAQCICFGSGAFMALPPPPNIQLYPHPIRRPETGELVLLTLDALTPEEQWILNHAEASLDSSLELSTSFITCFLGYFPEKNERGACSVFANGPHVSNRVGHAQGGILLGLAAATASTALPSSWMLSEVSAYYLRAGEGKILKAESNIVHHGRMSAVIRTEISDERGRRVMEVVTTHASSTEMNHSAS
jgi:acyl-coenzyme A thioesterase PaaI-like protein